MIGYLVVAKASLPVEFFSKLNYLIFGYFDPVIFFVITKINYSRGDLSDISAKTVTLVLTSATPHTSDNENHRIEDRVWLLEKGD